MKCIIHEDNTVTFFSHEDLRDEMTCSVEDIKIRVVYDEDTNDAEFVSLSTLCELYRNKK